MKKEKVVVYLKVNSDNKKEMQIEEERAKKYCNDNNMEIVQLVKDYKEDDTLEDLFCYVEDKRNGIYNLVVNSFNMLSSNMNKVYEYYIYLKDYCHCNLITLTHGSQFHFNIKLEKGAINEY